jgi:hypothetical protein
MQLQVMFDRDGVSHQLAELQKAYAQHMRRENYEFSLDTRRTGTVSRSTPHTAGTA